MVLPDAEVRIGDVGEFHGWRMKSERERARTQALPVGLIGVLQGGYTATWRHYLAADPPAQARDEERGYIQRAFPAG